MEELKKLIDILERKGKSSTSALINYSDDLSLETQLYFLFKNEELENETVASEKLYGKPGKTGAYKMLKARVKRKLYNQLFFLETEDKRLLEELSVIELKCRKLLYAADLLRKLSEASFSEEQLKKAVILAKEAELFRFEIDALEQLRVLYADRKYNRKLYDNCVERLRQLYKLNKAERLADAMFFDSRFKIKFGVNDAYEVKNEIAGSIEKLRKLWLTSGADPVFKRYHHLKMLFFELNGDFLTHIDYLEETFKLYDAGKIHPLYFSFDFNKYLLVFAYLKAKRYKEGHREAEALKNNLEAGSRNWFAHLENYFMLAVHSKDYPKAESILTEVLGNKDLEDTTTFSQERWFLFYKSLNYVSGYTCPSYKFKGLKHVTQDKKGYNVWNLILEFLSVLDKKQPDLIEREIDRLRKFSSKYLTAKEDARTKTFLKLLQIAGRDFSDSKVTRRKGTYLFNKLQQTPIPGIAYAETEIVHFEHLWEIILTKMERSK